MHSGKNDNQSSIGTNTNQTGFLIEDFFHAHYSALCFFAYQIVKETSVAEDLVTDFFVRIWQKTPDTTNSKAFRVFCYNSIRNACINWLKQQKRSDANQKQWLYNIEHSQQAVLETIIHTETIKNLHNAIQQLPPQCRSVFTKLYIEGKTVAETAQELNLAVSTVKSHKQAGLKILKTSLSLLPAAELLLLAEILYQN